ncbi:MAG: hypothetical protein WAV38_35345 [Xanthobacteraceae bacterium]
MSDDFIDDLDTPTEADLDKLYGSKYLGAIDLGDKKIRTRIAKVRKEMMQQQGGKPERAKFVLYFATLEKPMVLNATNKDALVDKLGKDPKNWINADIGLFTEPTQFGGKPTRGLRLRVLGLPKAAAKTAPAAKPKPAATKEAPEWPDQDGDPGPEFVDAAE